jgi:hypothetical protein
VKQRINRRFGGIVVQEAAAKEKVPTLETSRNDALKLFAMTTMFIDHIGYMLFPEYRILRSIGRLAFPIFAYQLAVGYAKTSSLKNYAKRLFVFALISQVPYSFFSPGLEFKPLELNIMFTLLLALGVVYIYDKGIAMVSGYRDSGNYTELLRGILMLAAVIVIIMAPEMLNLAFGDFRMDYGFYGLLLVLLFHINKDRKFAMVISYAMLSLAHTYFLGAKILAANSLEWMGHSYSVRECLLKTNIVWRNITLYKNGLVRLEGYFFQARSIFALIPIYLSHYFENKIRLNRYVGYWFYPVHIAVLVIVAYFLRMS